METLSKESVRHHCRICLQNLKIKMLFNTAISQCYHLQETAELKDWILALAPLQTLDKEHYPQYVCTDCYDTIKRFHEFPQLINNSAKLLDALFVDDFVTPNAVKSEIELEQNLNDAYTEADEETQVQLEPLQYLSQEEDQMDDSQDGSKFSVTFIAEDTAITPQIANDSDDVHIQKSSSYTSHMREILANISNGIYIISPRLNTKSKIWNLCGRIQKPDGTFIEQMVCCRLCSRLLRYNGRQTSNLLRHKCYIGKMNKKNRRNSGSVKIIRGPAMTNFEIETYDEIHKNILNGSYKISEKRNGHSRIWTVFGEIQRNDGSVIENIVYCRTCSRLHKYNGKQTSNLVRHNCYALKLDKLLQTINIKNQDMLCLEDEEAMEEQADPLQYPSFDIQDEKFDITFLAEETGITQSTLEHSTDETKKYAAEILASIESGAYQILKKNIESRIWTVFGEVKKPDGTIIEKIVYCRECRKLLKYNKKQLSNLVRHQCYVNIYKCRMETRRSLQKSRITKAVAGLAIETHVEILHNISTGVYKITERSRGRSKIWAVFGLVEKPDGTQIKNVVYCRSCRKLIKYNEKQTANLIRHKCYISSKSNPVEIVEANKVFAVADLTLTPDSVDLPETNNDLFVDESNHSKFVDTEAAASIELNETNEEVLRKIFTGLYKTIEITNSKSRIWAIFRKVQKDDANVTIIKDLVYCSMCKRLLKYNEKQLSNLIRHKCYKSTALEHNRKHITDLNKCYSGEASTSLEEIVLDLLKAGVANTGHDNDDVVDSNLESLNAATDKDDNKKQNFVEAKPATTNLNQSADVLDTNSTTLDCASGELIESNAAVLKKITSGLYKVAQKKNIKSRIWGLFGEIKRNNDTVIKNLVYCRSCGRLLKYNGKQTSNLIRHNCYAEMQKRRNSIIRRTYRRLNKNYLRQKIPVCANGKSTETHEEVLNKITEGTYTIVEKKNSKSRIWKIYGEVQKSDGTNIENYIYCRSCHKLMKYNGKQTSNLVKHRCYVQQIKETTEESKIDEVVKAGPSSMTTKLDPSTGELLETHEDVLDKITAGIYSISKRKLGKIQIWTVFRRIIKDNEAIIEDLVFCSYCCKLLTWDSSDTSNLTEHECYTLRVSEISPKPQEDIVEEDPPTATLDPATGELNETYREVLDKISAGTYKITKRTKIGKSRVWNVFFEIKKDDNTILDGIVYCRTCSQLMRYNQKQTSNLMRHKCYIGKMNGSEMTIRPNFHKKWQHKYIKQVTNQMSRQDKLKLNLALHQEVKNKIAAGIYRIAEKHARSRTWSVFRKVENIDGTTIENIVYCTKCTKLFKWNGKQTSNLVRHKCYVKVLLGNVSPPTHKVDHATGELVETYEEVLKKISAGIYNVAEKKKGRIWTLFGQIRKNDGTFVKNTVYCRQCCQLLRHSKKSNCSNLIRHKCYKIKPQENMEEGMEESC